MTHVLLRLYPPRWRVRYGDEFELILADRPLGPFDVADVVLGALDAHLHLRGLGAASEHRKGFAMSLRIGGYAAIIGVVLWVVGFAAASADDTDSPWPWAGVMVAGTVALLLALVGLSAFQARRYPRLVWAAFIVPAVGGVMSIIGILLMAELPRVIGIEGWWVWAVGTMALVIGSGLFAAASLRAGSVSRTGSRLLALAAISLLLGLPGAAGLVPWEPFTGVVFLAFLATFVGGWVTLGIGAIRADRLVPATTTGAAA
jgi:hypothetical protein